MTVAHVWQTPTKHPVGKAQAPGEFGKSIKLSVRTHKISTESLTGGSPVSTRLKVPARLPKASGLGNLTKSVQADINAMIQSWS